MVLDSGPRFYFGTLEIAGLSRYPRSRIRSLATFAPGDPYEVEKLDRFQRRLVGTGYFASVQVTADNAPETRSERMFADLEPGQRRGLKSSIAAARARRREKRESRGQLAA